MKTPFAFRILSAALVITTIAGCSTDLEINAPYKNITVVYGLLDIGDNNSVHYLKINKAFLAEGDLVSYAAIPDSTTFTDEQLGIHPDNPAAQRSYVEALDLQGQVVDTFHIRSMMMNGRDPGIFSGPLHKLYYFRAQLDSTRQYRVRVEAKGTAVTSETRITGAPKPNSILLDLNFGLGLATSAGGYSNRELRCTSARNGKRHEMYYRFNYREVRTNGDTVAKSFTRYIGSAVANGLNGGEELSMVLNGEDFYRYIGTAIPHDPDVVRRLFDAPNASVADGVDLIWAVAGPDLHLYMQLSNPVSGVVEDRPEYSNVQGDNAYGLVSSRRFREVRKKRLNDDSRAMLVNGPYTSALLFHIP